MKQSDFPLLGEVKNRDLLRNFIHDSCRKTVIRSLPRRYGEGKDAAQLARQLDLYGWLEHDLDSILKFFIKKEAWLAYKISISHFDDHGQEKNRIKINYRDADLKATRGSIYIHFWFTQNHNWVVS